MTNVPRMDMPAEGSRPSLRHIRALTDAVAGLHLSSPDHMIQETPRGTLIKHKTPFAARGGSDLPDPTILYKTLLVREYDEDGNLVAIGSESYPSLAENHTLQWTEDWIRFGGGET